MIKRRIRSLTILTLELYLFGNIFLDSIGLREWDRYNSMSCDDLCTRLEEFNITKMPEHFRKFCLCATTVWLCKPCIFAIDKIQ